MNSLKRVPFLGVKMDDWQDKYIRLYADFENYKKRTERDREGMVLERLRGMACSLLMIYDNLVFGARSLDGTAKDGLLSIVKQTEGLLKDMGFEKIESVGKMFDPSIHEAVRTEPSPTIVDGVIISVWKNGFFLDDMLVRPAMVVVSSGISKGAGKLYVREWA